MSVNSFDARRILDVDGQSYEIYDITKVDGSDNLPYSLKVLLENLLRTEDGANITAEMTSTACPNQCEAFDMSVSRTRTSSPGNAPRTKTTLPSRRATQ